MNKKLMIPIIITMILITGCKSGERIFENRHELEDLDFVRGLGIDYNNGKFRVSALVEKSTSTTSKKDTQSSQDESHTTMYYKDGDTITEAIKKIDSITDKHIYLGQTDFIIISENILKDALVKSIDFLSRDHEIRIIAKVFVSKNKTPFELFKDFTEGGVSFGKKLKNLSKHEIEIKHIRPKDILSIMKEMDNQYSGISIPSIVISNDNEIHLEKPFHNIALDGYEILKQNKHITYLNEQEILTGLAILNNNLSAGVINITSKDKSLVGLEVLNIDSKLKSKFNGSEPQIDIESLVESNINELHKPVDVFNENYFDYFNEQQKAYVKKCIEKTITFCQQNNVDILGFSDTIHRQHPYQWEIIKDRWDTVFPKIRCTINIISKIKRSYDVNQTQETRMPN